MVRCGQASMLLPVSNVLLLNSPASPCYSECTLKRNDFTIQCRRVQPTLELCFMLPRLVCHDEIQWNNVFIRMQSVTLIDLCYYRGNVHFLTTNTIQFIMIKSCQLQVTALFRGSNCFHWLMVLIGEQMMNCTGRLAPPTCWWSLINHVPAHRQKLKNWVNSGAWWPIATLCSACLGVFLWLSCSWRTLHNFHRIVGSFSKLMIFLFFAAACSPMLSPS